MPDSPTFTEARLAFSKRERVDENIQALVAAAGGEASADRPSPYFETLNKIQSRPVSLDEIGGGDEATPKRVYRFTDPLDIAILEYFLEEEPEASHLYDQSRSDEIEQKLDEGRGLLDRFDRSAIQVLERLVAKIFFARKRGFGGASAGDMLGCIWLSPPRSWRDVDFAEALYHESLHQALFLEEMVRGVYSVDAATMSAPEGQVVSAIRRESRPFDASFHAACVAAGLIDLYRFLGDLARVGSLVEGLRPSLEEIASKRGFLDDAGQQLLGELELRIN